MASNNNNSLPIPSTSIMLMEEFRGLEIYASCAIAIYFYELISCSFKVVKWYKSRLWTIPEVVCLFLEVISTLNYCILTLIFLHYKSHTSLSCTILSLLQQSFFTLSTSFHCFVLLIRFRIFYPNKSYLVISLFLSAMIILIINLINIVEFDGIDVNKQDGNCYLSNATVGAQSLSIGFVMLMIYCWVIWTSAIYAMYSTSNSPNFGKSRYWRRILFDNGLMYISLIALSQAMNVIIMFDGKSYLGKFINVTPLLVLTSICVQKSLVNTKSFNDRERTHLPFFRPFSSTNVKNINDRSINIKNIDDGSTQYQHHESFTTFQPYPQDQVRMPSPTLSSFTSSTKVDSVPPSLPPIIIHKSAKYDTSNSGYDEYNEKPQSPDGQRITQDFGSSLMFYLNAITRESNQHGIKLQNNKDRRSIISRLSNLSINSSHLSLINKGRISQQRFSKETRKSQQIPILVDPSELFYFTYSNDDDDEIYLFPAIPAPLELQQQQQQQQGEEEEEEGMPSFSNNDIRNSNESLTFPIHYPSFGFSATIIADDDDEHIFDHKKVVRASEVQGKFLKKYEDRESSLQD